jgi:flavin-dependent dehydrogenase
LRDVIIIGGGLAGLCNAIQLSSAGLDVLLIEKKIYPFHKVCGEYVSNEILPFLQRLGADIPSLEPSRLSRFLLSSPKGKNIEIRLDMGGFGVSRYRLDNYLYELAREKGVSFLLDRQVNEVHFDEDHSRLHISDGSEMEAKLVIGAFGKRSKLDRQLDRDFFKQRSPYVGVKYHVRADFPKDLIAIHNFDQGYCGINCIEEDKLCICYLTHREQLKDSGGISELERNILYKNPFLKDIFSRAEFLYDRPEVINEISFISKEAVKDHILMSGDAAGMITPLCGNGMAIAMHSSLICSQEVLHYFNDHHDRARMENNYTAHWNKLFARRLSIGRTIQDLFRRPVLCELAIGIGRRLPPLSRQIVRLTHGKPF